MTTWDELRGLVRAHLEAARGLNAPRPQGFDLKKVRRAGHGARLWPQVQVDLAHPAERLIVYGTLTPGGQYHHLLADLGRLGALPHPGPPGQLPGLSLLQVEPGGRSPLCLAGDLASLPRQIPGVGPL
jgi:hypothetical protein